MAMNDFENARTNTAVRTRRANAARARAAGLREGDRGRGTPARSCAPTAASASRTTGLDTYSCGNSLLLNTIAREHVRVHGLGADRLRRDPRLSDILGGVDSAMPNGNNAGIRDEPDPGNLCDPPFNNNVFADGAGLPGRRAGQRQDADPGCAQRDERDPGQRQLPGDSGHERRAMGGGARHRGLPHPDLDEPRPAARRDAVRLPERRVHRGRRGLHAGLAGAAEPRDADGPDFAIAKDVAEKSATLLKNSDSALPLKAADFSGTGVVVMGPTATATYVGGGGSAHVTPFEPITSSLTALRDAAGGGTVDYVQGYDLDGELVPSSAVAVPAGSVGAAGRPARRGRRASRGSTAGSASRSRRRFPPRASEPAACSGTCAADASGPDRGLHDRLEHAPGRHGMALDDDIHRTVGRVVAAQGLRQEPVERTALRRRARDRTAARQHRRVRRCRRRHRRLLDRRVGRPRADGEVARGARAPAGRVHADVRRGRDAQPRPARLRQRHDPLSVRFEWVPPDWQTQSIAKAVTAAVDREEGRASSPSTTAPRAAIAADQRPERRPSASRLAGRADLGRRGGEPEHGRRPQHRRRRLHAVALERQVGARDVVSRRRRRRRDGRRPDRRSEPERQAPDHVPGRCARRGRGSRPTTRAATRRRS